jgi:hypothetical protein
MDRSHLSVQACGRWDLSVIPFQAWRDDSGETGVSSGSTDQAHHAFDTPLKATNLGRLGCELRHDLKHSVGIVIDSED